MSTQEQEYLTFGQEVTDLWRTQRDGMERILTSMREGTLDGSITVDWEKETCGCAYGHIGNLDRREAYAIREPYREASHAFFTPLEYRVGPYRPGQTIENTLELRVLYEQLIAIRDMVYA